MSETVWFEQVDKRFEQVDKRFEQVDKRFEQVDERFEQVDERFEGIDSRLTRVEKIVTNIEHNHGQKLGALFDARTQDSRRIDIMDGKIDTLQKSVNDLGIRTLLTDNKLIDLSHKVR